MSTGLLDIIKQTAVNVIDNSQMCDLRHGKVTSVSPLKVMITSQLVIPQSLLVVPQHLTTHTVECTIGGESKQTITLHNELKVGDMVALLRQQGGQSYFILDRI